MSRGLLPAFLMLAHTSHGAESPHPPLSPAPQALGAGPSILRGNSRAPRAGPFPAPAAAGGASGGGRAAPAPSREAAAAPTPLLSRGPCAPHGSCSGSAAPGQSRPQPCSPGLACPPVAPAHARRCSRTNLVSKRPGWDPPARSSRCKQENFKRQAAPATTACLPPFPLRSALALGSSGDTELEGAGAASPAAQERSGVFTAK